MKKILVIDDEKDIRIMLKDYLSMEGYLVYTAEDGREALKKLGNDVDLILLDVNMPYMDGYTLCEKIREYVSCPILFLTARTDEKDRITGFKAGGDDYILKPFSIDELLARVKAHLRREERKTKNKSIYVDGNLVVDFTGKRVLIDNTDIGLTKTEYSILEFLITHSGQIFDKERIYENVMGFDKEGDSQIITEHIRRIRKKLENSGKNYIQTVWGVGYKWIG